ncbi:MAG: hypothetical protein PQJ60_08625, partial [Spirochaetales bacterium]|nr:hypothetical protein [Spirochaetales bacterium]
VVDFISTNDGEDNQSFMIYGFVEEYYPRVAKLFSVEDQAIEGSLTVDLYVIGDNDGDCTLFLGNCDSAENSSDERYTELIISDDGMLSFRHDEFTSTEICEWELDMWHTLTITWLDTLIVIEVDGVSYESDIEGASFIAELDTYPNGVGFSVGDDSSYYTMAFIDNLTYTIY